MNPRNKKIPLPVTSTENPGEQLFRELFNHIQSGVAIFAAVDDGKDFIIRDFNPTAEIIDKVKREDIIGRKVSEVFPGIHKMGLLKVFRKVWKTGQEEHQPITIYKDERIAGWRENFVFKLASGEIAAIYEDQTEKKQAEERMAWLASFPEVNPLIVVELDPNNKIRYCNPTALRQFPELMNADINHPFFNQFSKAVQELKEPSRTMATIEVEVAGKWFSQIVCKIFNNPNLRIYAYEITAQKHIEKMHLVLAEIIQASMESDDIHEFLGKVHQAISRVMVA